MRPTGCTRYSICPDHGLPGSSSWTLSPVTYMTDAPVLGARFRVCSHAPSPRSTWRSAYSGIVVRGWPLRGCIRNCVSCRLVDNMSRGPLRPDLRPSRPIMGAIEPGTRFGVVPKVIIRLREIGNVRRICPVSA